jgi:hypothetical protein
MTLITFGKGQDSSSSASLFSLGWDNDFWFQTDYYYTNGMSIDFQSNILRKSPLNLLLIPNSGDKTVFYGISLRQDMFTPRNTRAFSPVIGDRPYASYWLIGQTKKSYNMDRSLVIESGIYFGMSGQKGGGEWVQNGIHDILPASGHVNGWSNQLQGSFLLDYKVNAEKQLLRKKHIRISASAGGMLGAPYTWLNGGVQLYFGQLGVYPDPNFAITQKDFQIYGFTSFESKWVIYNETMQGSIFNRPATDLYIAPNPFVLQLKIGLMTRYKRFSMEISENIISPEFSGGGSHRWGTIRFFFSF